MYSKAVFDFIEKQKERHAKRWDDYVDSIYKALRKYSSNHSLQLEEHHFLYMEKDAERLIKEYGISMVDAEILAVVNFCQDLRFQGEGRIGYSMDKNYDEIVLKLLKKLSEKALEPFSEETKEMIRFA